MRVIFMPEARAETLEAYRWYEERRPGLGGELRAELKAVIQRIRQAPLACAVVHREMRRAPIPRFPHSVFYRVTPGVIIVVAVVHGRRHPREWKRRG